ncbi:MAG: ATP-binding protein [Omnitrophica bacterium]|nr:ATP-binding protein [Candidatus Omnitrophota bacterium]
MKFCFACILALTLFCPAFCLSAESTIPLAEEAKLAQAHLEAGLALEKEGRETEATAEYLKIIINYPEAEDAGKKAEERLSGLYEKFSVQIKEFEKYRPSDREKKPVVFFAYIKGLYENYRNMGQYDKAVYLLEKLYDMDSENASYLSDMGNIYLEGYNDPDKAISHFKKALKLNSNNPKAYIDLGKAYEKKGDFENALATYVKAAETFPASTWAIYGLKRAEGVRLTKERKLIKDWYVLGPFDNIEKDGLEKVFPPENEVDIRATYKGKNGARIRWVRPFGYEASGYVDLNRLITPNDYAVAFALTYVYSPNNKKVELLTGSDKGICIWVNDKVVLKKNLERSAEADEDRVSVSLKRGWNKVLVKVSDTWGAWGFYFRILGPRGNTAEDLIYDPEKNENRRKKMSGAFIKRKRLKVTGTLLIYTGALFIFVVGLSFMISNIVNRIEINRMKEDFISSVSHELKTPIAAIKIFAETLKRRGIKEEKEKQEYYGMIIKESDRLTGFINKVLNFSRLEKGGEIFEFKNTDIVRLARDAAEIYKSEVQDEKLEVRLDAKKDSIFAKIDRDAVLQVILNLIDNAYKYSGEKKDITITVNESGGKAFIEVIDKGPGIASDDLKKIFDKFYRAKRADGKGKKGSGLGLAFSKGVVTAHGGKISVESKLGKGSRFTITLKISREGGGDAAENIDNRG